MLQITFKNYFKKAFEIRMFTLYILLGSGKNQYQTIPENFQTGFCLCKWSDDILQKCRKFPNQTRGEEFGPRILCQTVELAIYNPQISDVDQMAAKVELETRFRNKCVSIPNLGAKRRSGYQRQNKHEMYLEKNNWYFFVKSKQLKSKDCIVATMIIE
jgi:hypothetical protein